MAIRSVAYVWGIGWSHDDICSLDAIRAAFSCAGRPVYAGRVAQLDRWQQFRFQGGDEDLVPAEAGQACGGSYVRCGVCSCFSSGVCVLRFNGMDDMAATTDILMGACYVACMVLLVVVMVKANKR